MVEDRGKRGETTYYLTLNILQAQYIHILHVYPFPSSLPLKLQTKILFFIFPALVRALFGQRSLARAANGQFSILSAPHTAPRPQPNSSYLPSFTVATS